MFTIRPREHLKGIALKRWYKRVNITLEGYHVLPINWREHVAIKVPSAKLSAVMDNLHKKPLLFS